MSDLEAVQMVRQIVSAALKAAQQAGEVNWLEYATEQLALVDAQLDQLQSEPSEEAASGAPTRPRTRIV